MSFLKKLLSGGMPGKNGLPKNLPGGSKVPGLPGMGGGGKQNPKPIPALNMGVRDTSGGLAPRAGMADANAKAAPEQASFVNPDKGRRLYPDSSALKEPMRDRAMRPDRKY